MKSRIHEDTDGGYIDAEVVGQVLCCSGNRYWGTDQRPYQNFRAADHTHGYDEEGHWHYPSSEVISEVVAAFVAAGGIYDSSTQRFIEQTRGMGVLWL